MKPLAVKLGKWELDNPIIPASGTFGYGVEFNKYYDINILGSFSFKGTTPKPRFGNDLPRIAEIKDGLLNSVGLQNNGIDHVIKYELQELKKVFHKKVIANIAAEDIKGYVEIIKKLNKEKDNIGIFEINVSCPNVKKGALKFDVDHIALAKLIKELKKISKIPLYIKLSPRVSDIVLMAKTCEKAGADGIVLVNTMPGLAIDINTHKPIMGNKIGGLSGPALKSIALRAVYLCYENIKIPIIGCGGITTCEDVIEFMMTGASAVEVGSSNLINPYICKELIETLPNVMKKYNISNIQSIVGIAHK